MWKVWALLLVFSLSFAEALCIDSRWKESKEYDGNYISAHDTLLNISLFFVEKETVEDNLIGRPIPFKVCDKTTEFEIENYIVDSVVHNDRSRINLLFGVSGKFSILDMERIFFTIRKIQKESLKGNDLIFTVWFYYSTESDSWLEEQIPPPPPLWSPLNILLLQ